MVRRVLTRRQLNRATLARQLLTVRADLKPVDAVSRLCGLQAQEARPPFIALWSRLADFRREDLHGALHARTLVRATGVRGTLHIVTAEDYIDSRAHLEPMLADGLRALGDRLAGLDVEQTVAAARRHLEGGPLTFSELRPLLAADFPDVNDRALGYATRLLVPLVMEPTDDVWGYPQAARFTLADQWLTRPIRSTTAAGDLVLRYLSAFGPASVADFQSWSGLGRMAPVFDDLRPRLDVLADDRGRELFDVPKAPRPGEGLAVPARLLPDFDSVLLAYDDRSRIIADEHRARVTTKNLRINAVFLVDGVAAGLWSVERRRASARMTLRPFGRLDAEARAAVTAEAEAALRFVAPDASIYDIIFAD